LLTCGGGLRPRRLADRIGRDLAAVAASSGPAARGSRRIPLCSESSTARKTTFGGEPALAWTAACGDGYDVNKLATLHGRHGYIILLVSQTANDNTQDKRIFDSIRSSFHFTRR
jgi:hypothetical protein